MPKKKSSFSFEASVNEIENLVQAMETGNLSLDESLEAFEKGVSLANQCQQKLQDAKQKVQILMEKDEQLELIAYSNQKV